MKFVCFIFSFFVSNVCLLSTVAFTTPFSSSPKKGNFLLPSAYAKKAPTPSILQRISAFRPAFALHSSLSSSDDAASSSVGELELGPTLSEKNRALVESFVKKAGGKRVIQRILIANNGMAATKAILSMRQWAYNVLGDEKAIEFVAMATRDDLNANAEFVRLADTFVEVPSGSNKNNYANVDLIVQIATKEKVDAVWPGWGHASENPRLPSTLKQKGIQVRIAFVSIFFLTSYHSVSFSLVYRPHCTSYGSFR
jgi:acetyl-CoA carboxylase/biotin carboxylase 1